MPYFTPPIKTSCFHQKLSNRPEMPYLITLMVATIGPQDRVFVSRATEAPVRDPVFLPDILAAGDDAGGGKAAGGAFFSLTGNCP